MFFVPFFPFRPGDRVIIYMPLIPEAVMAMLAVVRIGAIHSVVFGGKYIIGKSLSIAIKIRVQKYYKMTVIPLYCEISDRTRKQNEFVNFNLHICHPQANKNKVLCFLYFF